MHTVRLDNKKRARGYTLFEMVAVIVLSGIIAGIVAPPFVEAAKGHNRLTVRNMLLNEGKIALERMVRELRDMETDDGDSSVPDLARAETARIEFNDTGFRFSESSLERLSELDASWRDLSANVSELTFTYYDGTGNILGGLPLNAESREEVRRIGISIALSKAGETVVLGSGVFLSIFKIHSDVSP